jgi:CheY-like chemotaxis protein
MNGVVSVAASQTRLNSQLPENLRMLFVDDSAAALKLLVRRFKMARSDIDAVLATTGEEALALCEAQGGAFDVVVLDENMQSTGGLLLGHDVVGQMRGRLGMSKSVIIGCTGNAATCAEDYIAAGADDVWHKPTPSTADMVDVINYKRARAFGEQAASLPCGVRVAIIDDGVTNSKIMVRRLSM